MTKTTFKDVPEGTRLVGIGNFFRSLVPDSAPWRLAALLEYGKQRDYKHYHLDIACVLGVGRRFTGEEDAPFASSTYTHDVTLPHVVYWQEEHLGDFPDLWWGLSKRSEIASQRCLVFQSGDLTVWLPKFELARKLFFHASFLIRAAFVPNGLDMLFNIAEPEDEATLHIHTPARTGVPLRSMLHQAYQRHFSWLLLEPEARQSFESIWMCLNQEVQQDGRYERWPFNFLPPDNLHGTKITVSGRTSKDKKSILVGEIHSLSGLKVTHQQDVVFHHPSHRLLIRGNARPAPIAGAGPGADIEVDTTEEPRDGKETELIDLPDESISYDRPIRTRMAYNGERAAGHGRRVDDDRITGGDESSKVLGLGEPVMDGTQAPGELQQLGEDMPEKELLLNRFALLHDIIKQIGEDPRLTLISLEIKPLPQVGRCTFHLIDGKPRCCLIARFRLRDGRERYLLEIDISDDKKSMSTRIIEFDPNADANKQIRRILESTVKQSRWPSSLPQLCQTSEAVHHFKEGSEMENRERLVGWKQRLKEKLFN